MNEIIKNILQAQGIYDIFPVVSKNLNVGTTIIGNRIDLWGYRKGNDEFFIVNANGDNYRFAYEDVLIEENRHWVSLTKPDQRVLFNECFFVENRNGCYHVLITGEQSEGDTLIVNRNTNKIIGHSKGFICLDNICLLSSDTRITSLFDSNKLYSPNELVFKSETNVFIDEIKKGLYYEFSVGSFAVFRKIDNNNQESRYFVIYSLDGNLVFEGEIIFMWFPTNNSFFIFPHYKDYLVHKKSDDLFVADLIDSQDKDKEDYYFILSFSNNCFRMISLDCSEEFNVMAELRLIAEGYSAGRTKIVCDSSYLLFYEVNLQDPGYKQTTILSLSSSGIISNKNMLQGEFVGLRNGYIKTKDYEWKDNGIDYYQDSEKPYHNIYYIDGLSEKWERLGSTKPQKRFFEVSNSNNVGRAYNNSLEGLFDSLEYSFVVPPVYQELTYKEDADGTLYTIVCLENKYENNLTKYYGMYKNGILLFPVGYDLITYLSLDKKNLSDYLWIIKDEQNWLYYKNEIIYTSNSSDISISTLSFNNPRLHVANQWAVIIDCGQKKLYYQGKEMAIHQFDDVISIIRERSISSYNRFTCDFSYEHEYDITDFIYVTNGNKKGVFSGKQNSMIIDLADDFRQVGDIIIANNILYDKNYNKIGLISDPCKEIIANRDILIITKDSRDNTLEFWGISEETNSIQIIEDQNIEVKKHNGHSMYEIFYNDILYSYNPENNKCEIIEDNTITDEIDENQDDWDISAEMDYMRNNGGDWFED